MENRIKDEFKTIEYYQKELADLERRIKKHRDNIRSDNASRVYIAIGSKLLSVIHIKFQLGYDYESLKNTVMEYIQNEKQKLDYCDESTYNDVANLLSLSYLFDINPQEVEFINEHMISNDYIDIRLDIIRNMYFDGYFYSEKEFYYKDKGYFGDGIKATGGIVDIYKANEEARTNLFLKYLNTEKEKHHNRYVKHLEALSEDRYTYDGPIDFVLTAVVKAMNLDKELLNKSKYIATDLL